MRYLTSFLITLVAFSLSCNPAQLWAADLVKAEVSQHYIDQLFLKDQAHRLKMDLSDLEARSNAQALSGSEQDDLRDQMTADELRLTEVRADLKRGVRYLRSHWDLLTKEQRDEVMEEELYPE